MGIHIAKILVKKYYICDKIEEQKILKKIEEKK